MTSTSAPVEVIFAQKLASNEPKIRDRAVKKLSSFLRTHAQAGFTDDEMLRIWKGLHYCFWQSDKPLVQEELAEKISGLILVFLDHPTSALLFIRAGLVTLGREWFGIDRFRMDKYMMLTRRILRQVFVLAKLKHWEIVDDLARCFEEEVVCANKSVKDCKTSLGFQLHFSDVFLEELAKVGGEELEDGVIRRLLAPFIKELRQGKEERLRSHIEERVFHHLMRQSDVGIAYEQAEEDEDEEMEAEQEENEGDDEEDEDVAAVIEDGPKDPRAGRVDVTIPQLMVDYVNMAEDLFAAGSDKSVSQVPRRVLYRLTKQFRALANGKFPLAAELSDDEEMDKASSIKLKKVVKAKAEEDDAEAERRRQERKEYKAVMRQKRKISQVDEDDSGVEDESVSSEEEKVKGGKKRKVEKSPEKKKKQAKKDPSPAKKKAKSPSKGETTSAKKLKRSQDVPPTVLPKAAEDLSQKKAGEHVPVTKSEKKEKKRKREMKLENGEVTPVSNSVKDESATFVVKSKSKAQKESNESIAKSTDSPKKKKNKKNKKLKKEEEQHLTSASPTRTPTSTSSSSPSTPKPDSKKKKPNPESIEERLPKQGLTGFAPPTIKSTPSLPVPVFFKKAASKSAVIPADKKKHLTSSEPRPTSTVTTPSSSLKRKKINFALTCNKYQSVLEHSMSISESPEIPFSADKKPKQGVLKNKNDISIVNTPSPLGLKEVKKNTKLNGKSRTMQVLSRMRASDFI